jgi:hypothetical protein
MHQTVSAIQSTGNVLNIWRHSSDAFALVTTAAIPVEELGRVAAGSCQLYRRHMKQQHPRINTGFCTASVAHRGAHKLNEFQHKAMIEKIGSRSSTRRDLLTAACAVPQTSE